MTIECVITHDGKMWNLTNKDLSVSAATLEELDDNVRTLLRERGIVAPGEKAEVLMCFDNSTIPGWIRPYAQHYFNRIVEVEGDIV
ncbi:MAG: DUF5395 family protein [Candidatus Latescibacterota bacterium]